MNNYRTIQQKDMHKLFPHWGKNIPTLGTKCSQPRNKTGLRFALSLLLMFVLGINTAWGQTDYSGVWYIANETNHANANNSTHWYLVPGADPKADHYADAYFHNQYCNKSGKGDYTGDNYGDPEKPFLTTYQTNRVLNSIWIMKMERSLNIESCIISRIIIIHINILYKSTVTITVVVVSMVPLISIL